MNFFTLRMRIEFLRELEQWCDEKSANPATANDRIIREEIAVKKEHIRQTKKEIRQLWNAKKDPLEKPLTEATRTFYPREDGESWCEFGILKGQYSDEEIKQTIDNEWINIYSMYDCTGKTFTSSIEMKRTPSGTTFVHWKGLDV